MWKTIVLTLIVLALLGLGLVYSGLYNAAADTPHSGLVYILLETARERSIAARAGAIGVPDLTDPALIRSGAGNYDAMCVGCHLAPGIDPNELSRGLYPAPPKLAERAPDPARAFWVIKHGIKATGMPAWGRSIDDRYLWGLVAFLEQLPSLTPAQYQAAVAASEGHSHGGGETDIHGHGPERPHGSATDESEREPGAPLTREHRHPGHHGSHPHPH